jgi:hypothetical protein
MRRAEDIRETAVSPLNNSIGTDVDHSTTPKMRLGFIEAMNGRIIEVAVAVPNPHHIGHCDWKVELFIVPEDQKLSDALAMLMLLKGAK